MDAAIAQLETITLKLTGGSGDDGDVPACVALYNAYYKDHVQPFLDACGAAGVKDVGDMTAKAFTHQGRVFHAQTECAKPSDQDFLKFLGPCVEVITASGERDFADSRKDDFGEKKAFSEGIQALSWMMMPGGGKAFVTGQMDAATFYLNKVAHIIFSVWVRKNHRMLLIAGAEQGKRPARPRKGSPPKLCQTFQGDAFRTCGVCE